SALKADHYDNTKWVGMAGNRLVRLGPMQWLHCCAERILCQLGNAGSLGIISYEKAEFIFRNCRVIADGFDLR
ncbi:MAG: hypothetical protein V3R81_14465, partial [Gammaproteobacteria bacterium]